MNPDLSKMSSLKSIHTSYIKYIFIKRIWHLIIYNVWYAIKTKPTDQANVFLKNFLQILITFKHVYLAYRFVSKNY